MTPLQGQCITQMGDFLRSTARHPPFDVERGGSGIALTPDSSQESPASLTEFLLPVGGQERQARRLFFCEDQLTQVAKVAG